MFCIKTLCVEEHLACLVEWHPAMMICLFRFISIPIHTHVHNVYICVSQPERVI